MALFAGTRFCSCEVLAALGASGMGAVYYQLAIKSMAIIEGGLWLLRKGQGGQRHES